MDNFIKLTMFSVHFLAIRQFQRGLTMKVIRQERKIETQRRESRRESKKHKTEIKGLKPLVRELSDVVFSVKDDRDYYDGREDA